LTVDIYRLAALRDNYIYLLHDRGSNQAMAVDPGDAMPVLQQLDRLGATLSAILTTHHHSDHIGGNRALLDRFPAAEVYGGAEDRDRIPGQTQFLQEGDRVVLGPRTAQVMFVPGHTRAHIAYYLPPVGGAGATWGDLFCGDTLFAGGCGRLLEGTPQQLLTSLDRLRQLPDTTWVWCAHEYTLSNLRFAITVDSDNGELRQRLAQVEAARRHGSPTVPSPLGLEKRTNPFLRWDEAALQQAVGSREPVQTFARLRGRKDLF
jgi:hydroxyacylglutathione hydrolase